MDLQVETNEANAKVDINQAGSDSSPEDDINQNDRELYDQAFSSSSLAMFDQI